MTTALRKKKRQKRSTQFSNEFHYMSAMNWHDCVAPKITSTFNKRDACGHVYDENSEQKIHIQRVYVLRIEFISHQPPQHARQTSITYTTQKYLLFILVAFNRCSCHAIASKRILFYFRCKFICVLCDFFCISFVIGWWTAQNRTGQRR